jgi:Ca2+-binding RTX toxin-like protein
MDDADGNDGNDTVSGNGGDDVLRGSAGNDLVIGGQGSDWIDGGDGDDTEFGDDGSVNPDGTFNRADSAADGKDTMAGGAGNDRMFGQGGDDDMLGQAGNDTMSGDAGDDNMVGGSAVAGAPDGADVIDGGLGNDVMAGDNALIVRRGDTLTPLVRTLTGTTMYNPYNPSDALPDGAAAVTSGARANPRGVAGRDVTLYDHAGGDAANVGRFGADNMAGGGGDDLVFGQLGNDTLQGDSSTAEVVSATDPSANVPTDGNDYVEGNGGNDLIFGNGGQDDLIGGSSSHFGFAATADRPDGADTIFGGSGMRAAINDAGDGSTAGHATDADVIVGDNGNIDRLVNSAATAFLQFAYDTYGAAKIIPRAVDLLDYTPGVNPGTDVGAADVIHGEAGDDSVHGGAGDDKLYGDGQDDDLVGGSGNDWVSGGTGDDGALGDDGKLFTSRNGTAEPLYGIAATTQQLLVTNGSIYQAVLNQTGRLKKTADLEPFSLGGNDTVYGGLGNDSLHGGGGVDALSGAEALEGFYANPSLTPVLTFNNTTGRFDLLNTNAPMAKVNGHPLNFLAFNGTTPIDDGQDVLLGDEGADWLVGGTNADHLYGGTGNDVLNADDNLETSGGANNVADTSPLFSNTDIAYGGGGRDALIGNSTNDRLTDWVGEFNSYSVPFSQFGNYAVARQILPGLVDFLLKLSASDGADLSRSGLSNAGRNGEPFGELGMFLQQDNGWTDQTGAPSGP